MAKLADIESPELIPTSIDGLFVKDAGFEAFEDLVAKFQNEQDEPNPDKTMETAHEIFSQFIRDGNGDEFEDASSVEDIRKIPFLKLKKIIRAALEAMDVEGKF